MVVTIKKQHIKVSIHALLAECDGATPGQMNTI